MPKREGIYAVQIGKNIMLYDNPNDTMLKKLKEEAKKDNKEFKVFKITDTNADGWILTSKDESIYFNDFKKAFEYSHTHLCSVQTCKQIFI